jgi:hypothetical protein
MRIVLDTNVLISGTFWSGDSFRILQLVEKKKLKCYTSKEILEEYDRVMHSEEIIGKIGDKHLVIKSALIKMIEMCALVEPKRRINAVKDDPEDDKIIECAVEAKADFIVTQDNHLLKLGEFEGIRIVTPEDFLKIQK